MLVEDEILACQKKLEAMLSDIEELIRLIGDKQQLLGAEKKRAQQKLKIFKKKLNYEYWRISTRRGKASLNEAEKKYYAPAVRQVSVNLRTRTNSIPGFIWQKDFSKLASKIKIHINRLRQQL